MELRLYGNPGCPFCHLAANFLEQSGLKAQTVIAATDPIITEGVIKVTGTSPASYPVLVVFDKEVEVILGWRPDDYARVAKAYHAQRCQLALDAAAAQINTFREATPSPEPPATAEETARVSNVLGRVGSVSPVEAAVSA